MEFFNTTNETKTLPEYILKAKTQNEKVIRIYKELHIVSEGKEAVSASMIHELLISLELIHKETPLTSIRRSISTLTKEGILVKTDLKADGLYGRTEYKYKYFSM